MFDVAFFDLDGTLVNSGPPIIDSINESLAGHGMDPIDRLHANRFIGPPLYETLADLLTERGHDVAMLGSLIEGYRSVYAARSLTDTVIYPGITAVLAELAGQIRMGVVTSKPRPSALPILEALGLLDWFEIVEGPGLTHPEPKSVTLRRALDVVEAPCDRVLMIGDRRHDIEAGLRHGTRTAGVTWGFGDRAELEAAGAHELVDEPAALVPIVTS